MNVVVVLGSHPSNLSLSFVRLRTPLNLTLEIFTGFEIEFVSIAAVLPAQITVRSENFRVSDVDSAIAP